MSVPRDPDKGLWVITQNIINIVFPIGENIILSGGDSPEFSGKVTFGDNVYISVITEIASSLLEYFRNKE